MIHILHDQDLPENFNPGNGSHWPDITSTNQCSLLSITGLILKNSLDALSKTRLPTTRFGPNGQANLLMFVDIPVDSLISIVPLAGLQFEKVSADQPPQLGRRFMARAETDFFVLRRLPGKNQKLALHIPVLRSRCPINIQEEKSMQGPRINCQLTHLF